MSKYIIYRIDHHDPLWVGKRRRRLNIFFGIMAFIFLSVYLLLHQLLKISLAILYPFLIVIMGVFYLYFHRKLKAENKNLKPIGDIEFTQAGIYKHIGDSLTGFSYSSIKSIELQRHIPALTSNESKSGFYTYILSLVFADSHKESFVISDKPLGKWRDLSITETIKTLGKIIPTEIILR